MKIHTIPCTVRNGRVRVKASRYREFVRSRYPSATIKRHAADGWAYVFHGGSPWAIGEGKTNRAAWRDASRRVKGGKS